ncbi:MAG TPA: D-alanyl-D-alanine carboxypeptidase family protein [Stellaceae bacterium]|nr:D-alanyl-D-alanine carboxypeptidase family protein [Stellaceae bacterium]
MSGVIALVIAAMAVVAFGSGTAQAARRGHHYLHLARVGFAPVPVASSIVLDADTGQVLSQDNADALTYPASLTKMMTLYLTFEALNTGRLRLDQLLPVSLNAASKSPTKLGLRVGDSVAVQDLILGIVTRSANDAAAVLAEGIAGSEPAFAQLMNAKARQLGMSNTNYQNASGLPDPLQHTTARDTAQLALALYHDFPREYHYFATREFDFRGTIIRGHDHLLDWYPGADGIKTGFIDASGFNLASSAVRDGHRLIGVVFGGHSASSRDREMAALLDQGFAEIGVATPTAIAGRQPAAMPVPSAAAAKPVAAAPASQPHPGLLRKAAVRLAAHLSPVDRAEAATLPVVPRHEPVHRAADRWGIQLGSFHAAATAAAHAARIAAALPVAKGKPMQVLDPARGARTRLYRARLLDLTPAQAESACAQLHRKGLECAVVRPLRVATRD